MKGWIIYNTTRNTPRIEKLVEHVAQQAKDLGVLIEKVDSFSLIPYYDNLGNPKLETKEKLHDPDFILPWDKDLFLSRHLSKMGYAIFNNADAVEACDDKALTPVILAKLGIPMPKTILGPFTYKDYTTLTREYVTSIFEMFDGSVIFKLSQGGFGKGVFMVNSADELYNKILEYKNQRFIIQENIKTSAGVDIRVNIIGDEIVGSVLRKNEADFRANLALGGTGKVVELTTSRAELALRVHKTLGLTFSGIDLLFGKENEPILCEANSNPNFLTSEKVLGINYVEKLLNVIKKEIG